jgi:hypothetical protein
MIRLLYVVLVVKPSSDGFHLEIHYLYIIMIPDFHYCTCMLCVAMQLCTTIVGVVWSLDSSQ